MDFREYWDEIMKRNSDVVSILTSYWNHYSNMGTWQFWVVVCLLIIPLIILYFKVDRTRIFEVFFFGYTVHIFWTYIDIALERYSFLIHPYFLTPIWPFSLNITSSVLPVGFLLLYQYCTNNKKNFYFYTIILSAVFSFGFATFEKYLGLVIFRKGMNQFYLFLLDLAIVFISYWFTKLILKWRRN